MTHMTHFPYIAVYACARDADKQKTCHMRHEWRKSAIFGECQQHGVRCLKNCSEPGVPNRRVDPQKVSSAVDEPDLRTRLIEMRADALRQLAEAAPIVDCGLLALIAHAEVALAVIDDDAVSHAKPEPGDRAVVMDTGEQIALTVYSADRRCAVATLAPAAAIRLGNLLIAAGVRRL